MKIDVIEGGLWPTIRNIVKAFQSGIEFQENIHCVVVDVVDSGTANTEFTVTHKLGRVPTICIVARIDKAGTVYDSSTGSWSTTIIKLKCSAANARLKLIIS